MYRKKKVLGLCNKEYPIQQFKIKLHRKKKKTKSFIDPNKSVKWGRYKD